MGGSAGGGSTNITPRNFAQENRTIGQGYQSQFNRAYDFINNDPLLGPAYSQAAHFFQGLPGQLQPLQDTSQNYLAGILANQGALSPEASRDSAQYSRTVGENQYGMGESRQLGNLSNEILNRQSARENRYNTALQQYTGTQGAIQGLQTGGLNQQTGTAAAAQNVFSGYTNPILSYIGNLFSNNLQARIAQAGINQQGNIANQNKSSGLISSGISSIGSLAGAAALSDERVKTKISDTGLETPEGVPLQTWEYQTKPGVRYLGVMAQELEKRLPEMVLTDPVSGIKMVKEPFIPIEISPPEKRAA